METFSVMKKLILILMTVVLGVNYTFSQDLPYGKYLTFGKSDFEQANFKYSEKFNSWVLRKNHGVQATVNVLSALTGTVADIRPDNRDYCITVQMGDNEMISYIEVLFYNDDTYHKVMTFVQDNGSDILETNSGNKVLNQCAFGNYDLKLQMERVDVTATTGNTNSALVKSVDKSYNKYTFTIMTGVEATSLMISRNAAKKAKAQSKGKKASSVEDLM